MSDSHQLKAAFIGAGHHAYWTLYPCFQFIPQVTLQAVCDLDSTRAQTAARHFGARAVFTDYRRMLDEIKPDLLFCCGGPSLHLQVIGEAIDRRLPLFVEKPPAPTADQLLALIRSARQANVPIMIGFMRRFASLVRWTRQVLNHESFGKVMMLYGREGIWGTSGQTMILDSGIHLLDLMRYLGGEVTHLYAARHSDQQSRHGVAIILHFQNGTVGHLGLNSLESFSVPNNVVEVHGSQGSFVRIDNWSKVTWHRDTGGQSTPPIDPLGCALTYEQPWNQGNLNRAANLQGYTGEFQHFVDAVMQRQPLLSTLEDGYRALQLVEAVMQSCDRGEVVHLNLND